MNLEKCPEVLIKKVDEYLKKHENSKVIGVDIIEELPLNKDGSITHNIYMVALEWGNLCTSMKYTTYSKQEWNIDEVKESSMNYGEILNIVNNCSYLKGKFNAIDRFKDTLKNMIAETEESYNEYLRKFGEKDSITNWNQGRLDELKIIKETIEKY